MDYNELLELAKSRRSIRRFKPDPIPEQEINKVIEVARWAPSGFNMQPWEFVVVRKKELREKIAEAVNVYFKHAPEMEKAREPWQGRPWKLSGMTDTKGDFTEAPVYILLFGDPRTQAGLPMGVRYEYHRKQIIHTSGLAHAFVYMTLAATALGLAAQWISSVQTAYAHTVIKKLLDIPPALEVYDMLALGYPAIKPSEKFIRDLEEMVHYDDCGQEDFRSDEQVKDFVKKARSWNIGVHQRGGEKK
ncbi:MAG: nitroreductase family protein [Desulfobacteraceae bacterium]|nr:nitroreductase family protein [Desulfobacteraceae bacterium]MCF8095489.1 nitroreductase family protein [Desulfobacteraceae bacterium]